MCLDQYSNTPFPMTNRWYVYHSPVDGLWHCFTKIRCHKYLILVLADAARRRCDCFKWFEVWMTLSENGGWGDVDVHA